MLDKLQNTFIFWESGLKITLGYNYAEGNSTSKLQDKFMEGKRISLSNNSLCLQRRRLQNVLITVWQQAPVHTNKQGEAVF